MSNKDFISNYNRFSGYLWLVIAGLSFLTITYKIITEGAQTWLPYYIIPVMAILMYLTKRWMMKRMYRHLQDMAEQKKNQEV